MVISHGIGYLSAMTQFTIPGLTDKQDLEKFQWFVRAHLESAGAKLAHEGSSTEKRAANTARRKAK